MDQTPPKHILAKLLNCFFQQLYHSFAWSYDLVAGVVSLGRWNRWISTIYPSIPNDRILELGFGTGHIQLDLTHAGRMIFGVDESAQMCRISKDRLKQSHLPHKLTRAKAQRLPFPDRYFTAVVATFPSPYIFDNLTIKEIHRVLNPDGKLLILLAVQPGGNSIADKIIWTLFRITGEAPPHDLNIERIEAFFKENGFLVNHQWLHNHSDRLLLFTGLPKISNLGTAQVWGEETLNLR